MEWSGEKLKATLTLLSYLKLMEEVFIAKKGNIKGIMHEHEHGQVGLRVNRKLRQKILSTFLRIQHSTA